MPQHSAKSHTLHALTELRQKIVSGEIAGGTRLLEVALAEDLGISRTPVRAALSRLAEEGLLERGDGGGFRVRQFDLAEAIDTVELRGALEGIAARMAAERGAPKDRLAHMTAIVNALDSCFLNGLEEFDFDKYSELNETFHVTLSEASESAVIQREIARVKQLPFASPSAFLPDRTNPTQFARTLAIAQEQHRAIVAAIAGREGARAEALAREHARAARLNLERIFGEDQAPGGDIPGLALVTQAHPDGARRG